MSVDEVARTMARRVPSRDQAKSRIRRPSANRVSARDEEPSIGWIQMLASLT
jgi:hypothetical protein